MSCGEPLPSSFCYVARQTPTKIVKNATMASKEQIYTNYRLQLSDREILGTLVVRDGSIADIQPGIVSGGINGAENYLMPGLIELHTDNLERCISPRPKIRWPLEAAASYHDRALS